MSNVRNDLEAAFSSSAFELVHEFGLQHQLSRDDAFITFPMVLLFSNIPFRQCVKL